MSKVNGNGADEEPLFDRSRISHRENKRVSVLQARLKAAQNSGDPQELEACLNGTDAFLSKFLVSVPRSWLVPDAPDNLDWNDPESLNYLQADRYNDLAAAANPEAGKKGDSDG